LEVEIVVQGKYKQDVKTYKTLPQRTSQAWYWSIIPVIPLGTGRSAAPGLAKSVRSYLKNKLMQKGLCS
jgi:hypothetical protein